MIIDHAAARAFVEIVSSDQKFKETIEIIFDTFKLDCFADVAVGALLDRVDSCDDPDARLANFRATLALAFCAGSLYAEQARKARELNQLPEIIQ